MSFFGVELNAQDDRLLLQIRLKLSQSKFSPNFRTLFRAFVTYDPDVTGKVSLLNFEKALNANGFFYKKYQIQVFQKSYCKDGMLDWFSFLNHLKQPMGPQRRQLISQIFDNMDSESCGKIKPEQLLSHFNPCQIQAFKQGKKTKQILIEDFVNLLCLNDGFVTKQEFIAYYDDCSLSFPDTQAFIRYVSKQWTFTPQKYKPVKAEEVKGAIKALRFKLIQKSQGTSDQFLLRKLFNEFDKNKNQLIGSYELDLMMKKLEVPVQARLVNPLLEKLDKNQSGFIEYEEFRKFLFFDPYPL